MGIQDTGRNGVVLRFGPLTQTPSYRSVFAIDTFVRLTAVFGSDVLPY